MPFSLTYSVLQAVPSPSGEVVVRQLEEGSP